MQYLTTIALIIAFATMTGLVIVPVIQGQTAFADVQCDTTP
jgi:hypothetical protein